MIDLLSAPAAHWLAQTLLHFLWQGALVAIGLRVFLAFARSANQSYAASLGGLIVMLCLPALTFGILAQSPTHHQVSVMSVRDDFAPALNDFDLTAYQPALLAVWLLGVAWFAARLFVAWLGTLWLRGERLPLPLEIEHQLGWLERRLHIAARGRVFLSSRVDEAIAIGCWRPLVLLPVAWATELPPQVIEAVIAHELAHIRRLDLWATWLQRLTEALLFYHPAVWWVSRRISIERELCCDELAVSVTARRTEYAQALETIARRKRTPPLALSTSFGGGNMNLLERVRTVLSGGSRKPFTLSSGAVAGLTPLLIFGLLLGWTAMQLSAVADDDQPKKVAKEKDGGEKFEKKQKPSGDEDHPKKQNPKEEQKPKGKGGQEEFNLDKFKPENEREAQLLAVIHKLQSQIKQSQPSGDDARALKEKSLYKAKLDEANDALNTKLKALEMLKRAEEDAKFDKKALMEKEYKAKMAEKEKNVEKFTKGEPKKGDGEFTKKFNKGDEPKKGEPVKKGEPTKENPKGDSPKFQKEFNKGDNPKENPKFQKGDGGKENPKFQKEPNKKGEEPKQEKFEKGKEPQKEVNKRTEFQKEQNFKKDPDAKGENPKQKNKKDPDGEEQPKEKKKEA